MKILAKEEQHLALSSAYDDLLNKPTSSTIQTRFQARRQPRSVGVNSTKYLKSIFPKTISIGDLKMGHNQSNNSDISTQTGLSSCSANTGQTVLTVWQLTNDCPTHYRYDYRYGITHMPRTFSSGPRAVQCDDDHFSDYLWWGRTLLTIIWR